MEENFTKNQLKPGDAGYEYDKRVKFDYDEDELEENSWDQDDEEEVDSDEYDKRTKAVGPNKSKTALEIAMEKAMLAANADYDDEDYFDDDFA